MTSNLQQTSEPSFSVIIPTFGRPDLLCRAVASVVAQSYPAREIIVIDDGSKPPITLDPKRRSANVRLIRLPVNRGVAAARNAGIEAAKGNYIAFLDSDDTWEPRRLAFAAARIKNGRSTDKQIFIDNLMVRGRLASHPPPLIDDARTLARSLVLGDFCIPAPTVMFHCKWRSALQFDESLRRHEDWDLLISAIAAGFQLINLDTNQILVHGGWRGRLSLERDVRSAQLFLEKNRGYLSTEAIDCFTDLNIRSPNASRQRYMLMIVSRFLRRQTSISGSLYRLLAAAGFQRVAD